MRGRGRGTYANSCVLRRFFIALCGQGSLKKKTVSEFLKNANKQKLHLERAFTWKHGLRQIPILNFNWLFSTVGRVGQMAIAVTAM